MRNLYFIYGPEAMLKDTYIRKISSGEKVSKANISLDDLYWLNAMDLFAASEKVLVVERQELEADARLLSVLEDAKEQGLSNPLIVTARSAKENTKLFKFLKSEAEVLSAQKLSAEDYDKFLLARLKKTEAKITRENYAYLKKRFAYGESDIDLCDIAGYITQLSFFDEIDKENIDTFVKVSAQKSVFDLIPVIESDSFVAEMDKIEGDEVGILSAIQWALRLALRVKLAGSKSGVDQWQMNKLGTLGKKSEEAISKALDTVQEGINGIKSGYPKHTVFLTALAQVSCVLKGDR